MQKPSKQRELSRKGLCKGRVPAFTIDTHVTLQKMLKRYAKSGRAQNVSFRRLVHWIKVGERATHYLHSYPAKLLPQIAHFFIASSGLTKEGDAILDPFGGTGTVALESLLAKRRALYADANPLAQLIARVKTTPLTSEQLHRGVALFKKYHSQSPRHIADAPDVVNLYHWYSQTAVQELSRIKRAISRIRDALVREFLLVSFSSTCRKVSFADPRLSVPVRLQEADLKAHRSGKNVWEVFTAQIEDNLNRYVRLNEMRPNVFPLRFVGDDARRLLQPGDFSTHQSRRLRANSVPMVVTSPPYAGAQKYVRASSLNLGWLGLAG